MQNLTLPSRAQRKLSKLHLQELSAEAKKRVKWFYWHRGHGENVSLTCRHFGIARQTFYRWKGRYRPFDLSSLEDRSSRPRRVRQRTWTTAEVLAVQTVREAFSRWGKEKLAGSFREGVTPTTTRRICHGRIEPVQKLDALRSADVVWAGRLPTPPQSQS